jgi:hypothetical protein
MLFRWTVPGPIGEPGDPAPYLAPEERKSRSGHAVSPGRFGVESSVKGSIKWIMTAILNHVLVSILTMAFVKLFLGKWEILKHLFFLSEFAINFPPP